MSLNLIFIIPIYLILNNWILYKAHTDNNHMYWFQSVQHQYNRSYVGIDNFSGKDRKVLEFILDTDNIWISPIIIWIICKSTNRNSRMPIE
jgi:hypothetical protein